MNDQCTSASALFANPVAFDNLIFDTDSYKLSHFSQMMHELQSIWQAYCCSKIGLKRAGPITRDVCTRKAQSLPSRTSFHAGKASHSRVRWSWCMNRDWATPFNSSVTPNCYKRRGCAVISEDLRNCMD